MGISVKKFTFWQKKSSTIIQVALDRHHIGENCLVCGSQVRPSVFEELEQGQSQAATSSNYLNPNLLSYRFIKLESRPFITLSYFVDTTLILTILFLRLIVRVATKPCVLHQATVHFAFLR